jgi:ABC-type branched-subunit amino acid transport system permease subunit
VAPRRRLAAAAVGGVAGAVAGAALFLLGALVYQRLFLNSLFALVLVAVVFGGAGLYAGWLAGMMAFSAVRGGEGT